VEEETYTPAEAAKILRLTKRRVIQLITDEDLEGYKDEDGRWRIPQRAVHDRLGDRPPRAAQSQRRESSVDAILAAANAADIGDLVAAVRDLEYRLGRAEARAELTEQAESTLREQLQLERARAERERERAEQERERALELERELREERNKAIWRRLFRR
jgi:excisionase family DNA binding protein